MTPNEKRIDLSKAPSAMEQRAAAWESKRDEMRPRHQTNRQTYDPPKPAPKLRVAQAKAKKMPPDPSQKAIVYDRSSLLGVYAPPLPSPVEYAMRIPLDHAEALVAATRETEDAAMVHYVVAPGRLVADLRKMGLVCYGDRCLTTFGRMVRRELRKDW